MEIANKIDEDPRLTKIIESSIRDIIYRTRFDLIMENIDLDFILTNIENISEKIYKYLEYIFKRLESENKENIYMDKLKAVYNKKDCRGHLDCDINKCPIKKIFSRHNIQN